MKQEPTQKLVFTVEEARKLLGLSRALMYQAVTSGVIPSIRIGRRILIPKALLEQMLKGNEYH